MAELAFAHPNDQIAIVSQNVLYSFLTLIQIIQLEVQP